MLKSCRGDALKERILELYDVQPGARRKIPVQQRVAGLRQECCQRPLTDQFYEFHYTPRAGVGYSLEFPRESGSFYVGEHCGKKFIELLQQQDPTIVDPELFDPLLAPSARRTTDGDERHRTAVGEQAAGNDGAPAPALTPLNCELEQALQLLGFLCARPLDADLAALHRWLREHPDQDTRDQYLLTINDAIRAHPEMAGRTLRQVMDEQGARHGYRWKIFAFPTIEAILRDIGVASYFDPAVPSETLPKLRHIALVIGERGSGLALRLAEDGTGVMLFADCPGFQMDPPIGPGDELVVRTMRHPKGAKVVRIYARSGRARRGLIRFVQEGGKFAFIRPDAGGPDVFVSAVQYRGLGSPAIGAGVLYQAKETPRRPEASWVAAAP